MGGHTIEKVLQRNSLYKPTYKKTALNQAILGENFSQSEYVTVGATDIFITVVSCRVFCCLHVDTLWHVLEGDYLLSHWWNI